MATHRSTYAHAILSCTRGLLRNLLNAADCGCGLQDAIKKNSKDELPDFYNIVLDRPKDDAAGYDVLFIDAASKVSS